MHLKRTIQKAINFIKKIILWFLKHFGISFKKTPKKKEEKINIKQNYFETPKKKMNIAETISNSSHSLKKEDIKKKKIFLPSKEDLEKIFYTFIEKTFKLKINSLSKETQKKLQDYQKKTTEKIIPKIAKQQVTTIDDVEKILKEQLKEDLQKKDLVLEKLITSPNLYIEKQNILEKKEIIEQTKQEFYTSETKVNQIVSASPIVVDQYTHNFSKEEMPPVITNESVKQQDLIQSEKNNTNNKQNTEEEKQVKTEKANEQQEPFIEHFTPHDEDVKKEPSLVKEKEELEKKEIPKENQEKTTEVLINFTILEVENQAIIKEAKQEYNKEELIDKNYEKVEKLLEDKINEIEKMFQKPMNEIQKNKLKKEYKKLQETKENLHLYKEKDIEELRQSLEENIPLEELMLVTNKLKELSEAEELKRKEILYKDIEKKTQKEIQEINKVLLKESYKRMLRRLEAPLFLSYPFIKNKFFRKFISGLFIFRTFNFMKNLLLGFPDEYEPIDLSYIQKGSDALVESINLTEKNMNSFQELKKMTLIKYPELIEDDDFIKDIDKLENNLKKNYEKLIKHEQLVNKYFDKSKILIRKRKI